MLIRQLSRGLSRESLGSGTHGHDLLLQDRRFLVSILQSPFLQLGRSPEDYEQIQQIRTKLGRSLGEDELAPALQTFAADGEEALVEELQLLLELVKTTLGDSADEVKLKGRIETVHNKLFAQATARTFEVSTHVKSLAGALRNFEDEAVQFMSDRENAPDAFLNTFYPLYNECSRWYHSKLGRWRDRLEICRNIISALKRRQDEGARVGLNTMAGIELEQLSDAASQVEGASPFDQETELRELLRDEVASIVSHFSRQCGRMQQINWSARYLDVKLHIQRVFFLLTFFIFLFSITAGFAVQTLFVLQAKPLSQKSFGGQILFLLLPPMFVILCLMLHESFEIMIAAFRSPALCRFRSALLVTCCTSKFWCSAHKHTDFARAISFGDPDAEKKLLTWCQRIDFWFTAVLLFILTGCLCGIPFTLDRNFKQGWPGVLVACIVFGCTGILLHKTHSVKWFWAKFSSVWFNITIVGLIIIFWLAAFILPADGSWELWSNAIIGAMVWAFFTIVFGICAETFVSMTNQELLVQKITWFLRQNEIKPGRMSRSGAFGILMNSLQEMKHEMQESRSDRGNTELSSSLMSQAEEGTPPMSDSLWVRFRSLSPWKHFLMAYVLWFLGDALLYVRMYVITMGAILPVVMCVFSWLLSKKTSLVKRRSAYTCFGVIFWILGLLMSLMLQAALLGSSQPDGLPLMRIGGGSTEVGQTPYLACQLMWGSQGTGPMGLGLSILDLAALSQYAYAKNESYYNSLINASFGSTASTIHFDDFFEMPRVVGTRFKGHTEDVDTIVLAMRGTQTLQDWLTDFSLFTVVGALQLTSLFMSVISFVPSRVILGFVSFINLAWREEQAFRDRLRQITAKVSKQFPNATILYTGHSLGGSLAAQAGANNHKQAIVFSAPGQHFSRKRFHHTSEESYRNVFNIKPDFDLVPSVDYQDATVQNILCVDRDGNPPALGALQCHMLEQTICELWRACGDPVGRNFTGNAMWSQQVTCDWCDNCRFGYVWNKMREQGFF